MEELQELINFMKHKKENAEYMADRWSKADDSEMKKIYTAKAEAFSLCIDEGEQLLKIGRKQQPLE